MWSSSQYYQFELLVYFLFDFAGIVIRTEWTKFAELPIKKSLGTFLQVKFGEFVYSYLNVDAAYNGSWIRLSRVTEIFVSQRKSEI